MGGVATTYAEARRFRPQGSRTGALVMLGLFAGLALASILQGLLDVTLPGARGQEPFALLYSATSVLGPLFYFAYVLVHNLGLACIVPGFGFLAAWFERGALQRRVIGGLLVGGVASGLVLTLAALLRAADRFNFRVAIPLYIGEAVSVLLLAGLAARELARFDPQQGYGPIIALRWPLAVSAMLLALLAALETVFVFTVR